jgi:hypothetical protein
MFTDESFEKKAESPARMSQEDLLEFFNSLKPKEEVLIWYDSGIRRADDWTPMTVGRRSESKKYNLKKVSLTGKHGGNFILYNRQGKISLAMGGMATVLIAAKKGGSFGAEGSAIQHGDMVESWAGTGRVDYIRGDKAKIRLQDGSRSKFLNISGLKKVKDAETFEAIGRMPSWMRGKRQGNENHLVWASDSKAVREAIKTAFPEQKFSVRIVNGEYIEVVAKSGTRPADIEQFREDVKKVAMKTLGEIYENSPEELREKKVYVLAYAQDFGAETFEARGIDTFAEPLEHIGISKPYARLGVIAAGITALAIGVTKLRK